LWRIGRSGLWLDGADLSFGDEKINRLVENDRLLHRAKVIAIAGERLRELVGFCPERIASRYR
jgi:hypothetical protein